jgi:hypothetical protein
LRKMKDINSIFSLSLAVFLLFSGCSANLSRLKTVKDKRTRAEHRFDPLSFPGDGAIITGQKTLSERQSQFEQSASPFTQQEIPSSDSMVVSERDTLLVLFRVQVFASKSLDEVQQFAWDIEALFPEGVFVEYQVPYYKVRVGEFYNPQAGEEFLEHVKQLGFEKAWLTRVIK